MNTDWRALLNTALQRLIPMLLMAGATFLATKWADGAEVLRKLNAGDTVSLWHGTLTLSLVNIQFYVFTGIVAIVTVIQGWIKNVRQKREVNIARQLPTGATTDHIQEISSATPLFSSQPNQAALTQVARSIH